MFVGLAYCGLNSNAWAGIGDFEFQLVQHSIKQGVFTTVTVVDWRSGKVLPDGGFCRAPRHRAKRHGDDDGANRTAALSRRGHLQIQGQFIATRSLPPFDSRQGSGRNRVSRKQT